MTITVESFSFEELTMRGYC